MTEKMLDQQNLTATELEDVSGGVDFGEVPDPLDCEVSTVGTEPDDNPNDYLPW